MALSLPAVKRSPRFEVMAPIIAHEHVAGLEHEVVFEAPAIARNARPGQFLELAFQECNAPETHRPFSLYRVDAGRGTCSILYLARGSFTRFLALRQVGETVGIVGPLGRPFTWPEDRETCLILIAGGIGASPLLFLARELCRERGPGGPHKIIVINGARTREALIGMTEFYALDIDVQAITEDGSSGRMGLVTDVLSESLAAKSEKRNIQLYACGPAAMLRAIASISLEHRIPSQISVETRMPCGIGICNECRIRVRDETAPEGYTYALACWDGPVFEARDLIWEP